MPTLHVTISNKQRKVALEGQLPLLQKALSLAFALALPKNSGWPEEVTHALLELTFCSAAAMRTLNREQREVDRETDVLSFPGFDFYEGKLQQELQRYDWQNPEAESGEVLLGEIVISPGKAVKQADEYGHSFERELVFLAIHGLLHCLGYDHMEAAEEQRMREKQREIMEAVGLGLEQEGEARQVRNDATEEARDDERLSRASSPSEASMSSAALETQEEESKNNELSGISRCGCIALVGRPNVGKSTLLNELAGSELAITSPKAQTTRSLIRAVINDADAQMIFIDSPGIHVEKHALDRAMSKSISVAMDEADVLLLLIEASFKPRVEEIEKRVARRAHDRNKALILVLNKCDIAHKAAILPLMAAFNEALQPAAIVPISAKTGEGLDELLEEIKRVLPEGPAVFSEEVMTDQTEGSLVRELVRSEILRQMKEEIPHQVAVVLESFDEDLHVDAETGEEKRVRVKISAIIYCERSQHKAMLLGKGGERIKEIGSRARERMEYLLDCPCDLHLFVKVKERWSENPAALKELGYGGE